MRTFMHPQKVICPYIGQTLNRNQYGMRGQPYSIVVNKILKGGRSIRVNGGYYIWDTNEKSFWEEIADKL